MQFIIHWENRTNFVNNEGGKSAKNRVGHKSGSLSQRIVITTKQNEINKQLKREIEAELISKKNHIRHDGVGVVYINGKHYTLNCRNPHIFSKNLVNQMLRDRHLDRINGAGGIDNVIKRTTPKLHDTMVIW